MRAEPPQRRRPAPIASDPAAVVREMRAWVEQAVIGLNLCPFAKAVQVKDLVRYRCCDATEPAALLAALHDELRLLQAADPAGIETTLLIHPHVLQDFRDFNDFAGAAEAAVHARGLDGVVQIASFHPRYRFAGTRADDLGNATNRSPYPCLHLLREDSVARAVASFPEPEAIYENNIRTLRALGRKGWQALQAACRDAANAP